MKWKRSGHLQSVLAIILYLVIWPMAGCKHKDSSAAGQAPAKPVSITLDWQPEPEFGGFYQAQLAGGFSKVGLADVELHNYAGGNVWQLVANGQSDFATTSADQVLLARARGADVVALFAVYQTSPQGIMVHKARGFTKLQDVFSHTGTLAAEDNAWLKYVLGRFGKPTVTITGLPEGVGVFLAKPDYSQQCFITSEPILAKRKGGDPQTFLISEAGFNPYTTVLITSGKMLKEQPERVKKTVTACRAGWRQYLDDPAPANAAMHKLNTTMDPQTFAEAAAAQKPLIETSETRQSGLGTMTAARWDALAKQLVELKVIESAPAAGECFRLFNGE
ncbi:MAG TPA: ABC transporter substrate-binding protein [Tepidisphaeraceae bacterium]|nr:ABC transporter substrate-binding protein [Tepidisphaeraceae bacterium]